MASIEVRPIRVENSTRWPASVPPAGTAEMTVLASPGANKRISITGITLSNVTASGYSFQSKVGEAASVDLFGGAIFYVGAIGTVPMNFPHTVVLPENAILRVTPTVDGSAAGAVIVFGYDDYT